MIWIDLSGTSSETTLHAKHWNDYKDGMNTLLLHFSLPEILQVTKKKYVLRQYNVNLH